MQIMDANRPVEPGQLAMELPAVKLPAYVPPAVFTYTDEQLLEALGPAQAQPYSPPG